MRIFSAILLATLASSAAFAQPSEWSAAQTSFGTASIEMPCSKQAVQTKERDGTEAVRCDVSDVSVFLLVLKNEMIPRLGFPVSTIAEMKYAIRNGSNTEYLIDDTVSGFPAFYSEVRAPDGKIAFGFVELDDGRTVMLNVQSDGSPVAEAEISGIFVRSWGSLQVTKP